MPFAIMVACATQGLVIITFPQWSQDSPTGYGPWPAFAILSLVAFCFVWFFLPETAQLTLEEVEELFAVPAEKLPGGLRKRDSLSISRDGMGETRVHVSRDGASETAKLVDHAKGGAPAPSSMTGRKGAPYSWPRVQRPGSPPAVASSSVLPR